MGKMEAKSCRKVVGIQAKIPIETISCDRGKRISGYTKTSTKKLFLHGLNSLSIYMETIVLNFFLISLVGVLFILVGLLIVFYLRFFTIRRLYFRSKWLIAVNLGSFKCWKC